MRTSDLFFPHFTYLHRIAFVDHVNSVSYGCVSLYSCICNFLPYHAHCQYKSLFQRIFQSECVKQIPLHWRSSHHIKIKNNNNNRCTRSCFRFPIVLYIVPSTHFSDTLLATWPGSLFFTLEHSATLRTLEGYFSMRDSTNSVPPRSFHRWPSIYTKLFTAFRGQTHSQS